MKCILIYLTRKFQRQFGFILTFLIIIPQQGILIHSSHCVKSARIRSYSGLHFPAFGQNTERCKVSLCIQSGCGKIRSRITPSTDPFHAKYDSSISVNFPSIKPVFSMSETILRYTLEPPVM